MVLSQAKWPVDYTAMAYLGVGTSCAVWFRNVPDNQTLCHEAFHVTNHVLTNAGLELNSGSEEAWAYHQAFIVRKISRKLW